MNRTKIKVNLLAVSARERSLRLNLLPGSSTPPLIISFDPQTAVAQTLPLTTYLPTHTYTTQVNTTSNNPCTPENTTPNTTTTPGNTTLDMGQNLPAAPSDPISGHNAGPYDGTKPNTIATPSDTDPTRTNTTFNNTYAPRNATSNAIITQANTTLGTGRSLPLAPSDTISGHNTGPYDVTRADTTVMLSNSATITAVSPPVWNQATGITLTYNGTIHRSKIGVYNPLAAPAPSAREILHQSSVSGAGIRNIAHPRGSPRLYASSASTEASPSIVPRVTISCSAVAVTSLACPSSRESRACLGKPKAAGSRGNGASKT